MFSVAVNVVWVVAIAMITGLWSAPLFAAQMTSNIRSPIRHLIVIVGENRSFDNIFATYTPPPGQTVWNLLSKGIVKEDGTSGPNFAYAVQRRALTKNSFELSPEPNGEFNYLPQPSTSPIALPIGFCKVGQLIYGTSDLCYNTGLNASQEWLLSTLGTGQPLYFNVKDEEWIYPVADCRYPANLPNGPYSLVGASVNPENCTRFDQKIPIPIPIQSTNYTNNTGDPVHRFYQMWQQSDCSIDHISNDNPSGCINDLYTWVAVTVGWGTWEPKANDDYQATYQGGIPMGYYNMAKKEWPYFRLLAQSYAISDNYHQPLMGGTGPNSQFMGTGDVYYFTKGEAPGIPAKPIDELIEDPDPKGDSNFYKNDKWNIDYPSQKEADYGNTGVGFTNCADESQPGVKAIIGYLNSLENTDKSFKIFNGGNCEKNTYYQVNNNYPYYRTTGEPISNAPQYEFPSRAKYSIGPQTIPTIGDALSQRGITWKYYGQSFDRAASQPPLNKLYCAICNPFQYATSIMTSSLRSNLVDFTRFYGDVANGTLPAVSFVKPDLLVDSHPGTSTPPLFEEFVRNIIDAVKANDTLWQDTAILITFDEAGGYYDSGYIQPIDFFGDGPRTPLLVVSLYAKKGYVDHTYTDHASILKFIEWNWNLNPLSKRSRDNLPNPVSTTDAPYFPIVKPAIGDLQTMFDFGGWQYPVTVLKNGFGTVISSPEGINCGSTCYAGFSGNSTLTLVARPDDGYRFSGWNGDCKGADSTCSAIVDAAKTITANFVPAQPTVTLKASPNKGSRQNAYVLQWSSTNSNTCSIVGTDGWSSVVATSGSKEFTLNSSQTYSLTCWGNGGSANASVTITLDPKECFFGWMETAYPPLFSPSGAATQAFSGFVFRYYWLSQVIVAISPVNNHLYFLRLGRSPLDFGDFSAWLGKAGCH